MSATLFSSFLSFVGLGIYVLFFQPHLNGWVSKLPADWRAPVVCTIVLSTALYFYYFAALTELHKETREALQKAAGRMEWAIRVGNQGAMLLMWFVLTDESSIAFELFLPILYLSFLIWDCTTWKALKGREKNILMFFDVLGLLLVTTLVILVGFLTPADCKNTRMWADEGLWMGIGFTAGAFGLLNFIGVATGFVLIKFNPFERVRWRRVELH